MDGHSHDDSSVPAAASTAPAGNLKHAAQPPAVGERFEPLLTCRNVTVERIVSSDAPDTAEVVQTQDEWVALLTGQADLRVADRVHRLAPGDWLFLPAGTPHAVLRTSPGATWLAVHIR